MGIELIIRSILLGVGLAMDAFSVTLADGLGEKNLNAGRTLLIAGVFAVFQFAMPMAGWLLIHTAEEKFAFISMFIPWAALLLLVYIGGKMFLEGIRENREIRSTGSDTDPAAADSGDAVLTAGDLIIQGIATSIDALSVGVTFISFHQFHDAALENQYVVGESISRVAASFIDGDRVPDYIKNGDKAEGYLETKGHLYSIMRSSPDIAYVYVYKIKEDGCHVVFDLDTDDLPGEPPGTVIDFDSAFDEYLDDLLEGREIPPVISDETYGWLLTFYQPVYDDAGVCQCYAAVDISMPRIIANEQVFMARTIALFPATAS